MPVVPDSSLFPPQREILEAGLLTSGFNCILQMPTGSGKTWLAEQAIAHTLERGLRAVYLTPLRALATELMQRWQTRFGDTRVGIFTGDFGKPGSPYPVSFKDAQLLVMTPERLDACTRSWRSHWSWLPEVDLVVVDEFHLLGDRQRGARLEGTLSRIRRLNPFVSLLCLSATLGNRQELADWLGGVEYSTHWRPIPITWRIVHFKKADDKPELLAREIGNNTQKGGKSLVFVQSRRRAEELGGYLHTHGLRARHHHAGLVHADRQQVEHQFRNSNLDVLVATSTLEMGLNLPVRQVLLYDLQQFDGVDFQPLPTNSVWQRVGRAGRRGLDDEGEAVLLAPSWDRQAERYEQGHYESIRSGLSDTHLLAEQVIAEVASGLARTPIQLKTVFAQSLAQHQACLPDVERTLRDMLEAHMLEEKEDEKRKGLRLRATRLGYIAVRHMLTPTTVLLFRRLLEDQEELTFFDLLLIAASTNDCEPVLPVDFEELDALAAILAQEPSFLLQKSYEELSDLLEIRGKRLLSALKMAIVTRSWTRHGQIPEVAELHDCYPFEVNRLCESLERLLTAMNALQIVPEETLDDAEHIPLSERLRLLLQMIVAGLNESTATLTLISGIGPAYARLLQQTGIEDIEDLALADADDLGALPGLSSKRAAQWIQTAEELIKTHPANRYREDGPTIHLTLPTWPADIDPYRLRRALDLQITNPKNATYIVTGGLEPHRIQAQTEHLTCDCADAKKGHTCKHQLAVRLHTGDPLLRRLTQQLSASPPNTSIDLFDLWFADRSSQSRRRAS